MRIGIFTETYTPYISGLVTSEVALKKSLEEMGHEVYVVTANLEKFRYKYDEKEHVLKIPGVPTGIYDSRLTSIYPVRAINKIKSWNLDVIHSQTEFAIGTFARIIAKQYDIPLVHTYHTMYEDYVHYITKGHFDKSSKKIVEYLTLFYCDKTITELIVPTKKTYDLFKSKYKVDRDIHIIPTGIDTKVFNRNNISQKEIETQKKKYKIKPTDFIVLFVGRLGKEKNIDFLLECHNDLKDKYKNLKLMIVGDGPDLDHFKEIIKNNNMEDRVILTGKVPQDKVKIFYNLADIFATASQTETQGLTVIEAMSASLPVLAIDDESFRNVVIDEYNGYIFETKDQYKEKLELLMKDKKELELLSKQALTSSNNHSLEHFATSVLEVYKIAINKKNNKTGLLEKINNFFEE